MNFKKKWLLSVCAAVLCVTANAQEKYTKVKIATPTQAIRGAMINSLGLDHYERDATSITAIVNSSELEGLRHSGQSFQVLIDDVVQNTIQINKNTVPSSDENNVVPIQGTSCQKIGAIIKTPTAFGTGGSLRLGAAVGNPGYLTYAEMYTAMNALATANPSLVKLYSIGKSDGGLDIWGIKISDNSGSDENEPEVLYTGLQHAREAIGGTSLVFYMQYLIENYTTNPRIKELVDSREIFIIPCLNPDGYSFNYGGSSASYPTTGGGLWRKNRRNTGGGASNIGVDLNRNYGVDWGNCAGASTSCGSTSKTADTYFGTSAFSEPETQALRAFVYQHSFVNAIDQHCFGPYYSLPYGRPSLHTPLNHADSAYYTYVPALMGMYNGHRAGNSPETVNYEVAGGIKDWLLMGDIGAGTIPKTKIYGMTGEAGGGEFWAPVAELIQLCKENTFQNLQLAYAAGAYFDMQDKNDISINTYTGNFSFIVKRVGLKNSPFTVSIVPLENIDVIGAPVTASIPNYYDSYTGNISYGLSSNFLGGQKIRFVLKLESDGITILDTVTKFFNPLTLLSDDMEGSFATNWTAAISPSVAGGWAFTNLSAFEGNNSMTESPNGNYTASSTRTVTCKTTFNLADASAAHLSFWTRHRAENFRDKLQVQVTTDAGNTWLPVCGSNMVSEDNTTNEGSLGGKPALTGIRDTWTREIFDLTAFKGTAALQFRFQFTSDNDASAFAFEKDDGFYIDNVKLIKTAKITTLNVKFVNFFAKLLPNNTVQLDWEAFTDLNHSYFEVEKATSANGTYTSIAKVPGLPPYKSFDLNPNEGTNYYRIKQVNKDGTVTYSKVITINYSKGKTSTIIYPNPVKDMLSVKVANSVKREDVVLRLTNVSGQVVMQQPAVIKAGETEIKMNLSALPAQVYFLKIVNGNNETLSIEKVIKQ